MRSRQPDQPVTQILALKQNKDHKNDDDAGRRQRMKQWRNQTLQALQRARIGLAYFHGNGWRRRSFGTEEAAPAKPAGGILGLVQLFAQILQHARGALERPAASPGVAKRLDLLADRRLIPRQVS